MLIDELVVKDWTRDPTKFLLPNQAMEALRLSPSWTPDPRANINDRLHRHFDTRRFDFRVRKKERTAGKLAPSDLQVESKALT